MMSRIWTVDCSGQGTLTLNQWDAAAEGALFDESRQLSRLIGRPTTPLSVAVGEVLEQVAAGRPSS
jgi:hypothetical protein